MTIRRLTRPRTPPHLRDAGWHLCALPGGFWWCVHPATETETPIATSAGRAIMAAELIAEPDGEQLSKWWREEQQARMLHKLWKVRMGCRKK